MTKQQILNHFHNGDVVECLDAKVQKKFDSKYLKIIYDLWVLDLPDYDYYLILERNGQLARIIQPDKTEVYAQLGKEVLEILKANPNDADAGSKSRKLYGK